MFINSKKAYEFPFPDGSEKVLKIPAAYIGPIEDWVAKTKLFMLAVEEGSITMVGRYPMSSDTPLFKGYFR